MINIEITNQYKSTSPCNIKLPKFTVLTGLNGSGKSHLLEAISKGVNSNVYIEGNRITKTVYIPFNGLNPSIAEHCDPKIISDFVKKFYQLYIQALQYLQNEERVNPRNGQRVDIANIVRRMSNNTTSQEIKTA